MTKFLKRGNIVADTLLLMTFPYARKLGNTFCVPDTKLCPQQMLRARASGETFVSATMCPRVPVPKRYGQYLMVNTSHGLCSCLQHGKTHIGREDAPNPQDIGKSIKKLIT